jgi:hypothetical protein
LKEISIELNRIWEMEEIKQDKELGREILEKGIRILNIFMLLLIKEGGK